MWQPSKQEKGNLDIDNGLKMRKFLFSGNRRWREKGAALFR